jgi:Putative peptidoglycan binding domain
MSQRNLRHSRRFLGEVRKHLLLLLAVPAMAVLGPLTAIALAANSGGAGLGGGASAGLADTTSSCATTTPTVATTPTGTTTLPSGGVGGVTTCTRTTAPTPTVPVPVPTFTTTTPMTIATTTTPGKTTTTKTTPTKTTPAKPVTYPYTPPTNTAPAPAVIPVPKGNPLARRGMWIWVLGDSDRGNVTKLIEDSKQYGIGTLLIKSGDGTNYWKQFSPKLVSQLHAAGLKVCAWQYVYGINPVAEAQIGARAVKNGADCLVIDAETQYQGKYVQAQTYVNTLRHLIGNSFPVALAGFPYVDYHLSFPYSVFLGPNGAQYNIPQMYWQDIGVSPTTVYSVTYEFNEIYQRPIFPLGQLYDNPPSASIAQFSTLATKYGATGLSWWDWQSSGPAQMDAATISGTLPKGFVRQKTAASIGPKSAGDLVLWAQEHLYGAGYKISIDGSYGSQTRDAVAKFQSAHGLPASGTITGATWNALLKYQPVPIKWVVRKNQQVPTVVKPGTTITVTVPATTPTKSPSTTTTPATTPTFATTPATTDPAPSKTVPQTGASGL